MAINTPITGAPICAPFVSAPPAAITRILSRFDRRELEGFISVALDLLDLADGDPEAEEIDLEDSFALSDFASQFTRGAGCVVSDDGDNAWVEWDKMRPQQKRGPNLTTVHEDDEDYDPAEEDDDDTGIDDRLHDDEFDREDAAEYDAPFLNYSLDQSEPLPWCPDDDLMARIPHRDRIRRERCEK